jgi:hypothetical protein
MIQLTWCSHNSYANVIDLANPFGFCQFHRTLTTNRRELPLYFVISMILVQIILVTWDKHSVLDTSPFIELSTVGDQGYAMWNAEGDHRNLYRSRPGNLPMTMLWRRHNTTPADSLLMCACNSSCHLQSLLQQHLHRSVLTAAYLFF